MKESKQNQTGGVKEHEEQEHISKDVRVENRGGEEAVMIIDEDGKDAETVVMNHIQEFESTNVKEERKRGRMNDSPIEDVKESEQELPGWKEHKEAAKTAQENSAGGKIRKLRKLKESQEQGSPEYVVENEMEKEPASAMMPRTSCQPASTTPPLPHQKKDWKHMNWWRKQAVTSSGVEG